MSLSRIRADGSFARGPVQLKAEQPAEEFAVFCSSFMPACHITMHGLTTETAAELRWWAGRNCVDRRHQLGHDVYSGAIGARSEPPK